jgi:hypothetical protein
VNVGLNVGATVGALVGEVEGLGVGAATVVNVTVAVVVVVAVVAELRVTVTFPLVEDEEDNDVTVVPVAIPVVEETVEPTAMELATEERTLIEVDCLGRIAEVTTVCAIVYVGDKVGDAEGIMLGEAVGLGVGKNLL